MYTALRRTFCAFFCPTGFRIFLLERSRSIFPS
ncbi:hypothetical protein [Acididesulfobacillus acetoxydans]